MANEAQSMSKPSPKWLQADVYYLVLEAEEFIVFLDSDIDVGWQTSAEYDKHGPRNPLRHNENLNRAATLECIPNSHHSESIRRNFKRMVGEGVARSLDGDYDSAVTVLDQAEAYITSRNVETARFWQLSSACIIGAAIVIIAMILWSARTRVTNALGDEGYYLLGSALAGGVGAVLSMIFRMGHYFPSSEAPRALHVLESGSRIFAGGISGALVSGSVAIGLILPVISKAGELHGAMLIAGLASGASERWAPSLIGKLETHSAGMQPERSNRK